MFHSSQEFVNYTFLLLFVRWHMNWINSTCIPSQKRKMNNEHYYENTIWICTSSKMLTITHCLFHNSQEEPYTHIVFVFFSQESWIYLQSKKSQQFPQRFSFLNYLKMYSTAVLVEIKICTNSICLQLYKYFCRWSFKGIFLQ